ncbi:exodeoxyribonuclease V subunit gamma [Xylophilus rhododendri]|uniref:RecBCD enzyme subunit RecC n=1 Tax=Xylophilus rhododendri TaxID=2697032 RepID=A0A857J297_9BURK|nr:exodeoxyribonuclease V subunit gamma [Xylophilus rhododendri]QHI97191.1 exodeoxyribonuclease V subunit gamma [Xylophilus rhododendri]
MSSAENHPWNGFMAVHGNQPEQLRDLMLAWAARHPLAPLEDERILVQSNGVAQWLKLSLARDPAQGGIGIAAALRMELPSRFFWQAYRAVLGAEGVPATSPFDKQLLVWRLMRLLPALLQEPVFAPLERFLQDDSDMRKRWQLAQRLADLFDQYQVYRADWLADWAADRDELLTSRHGRQEVPQALAWQPRLWRALLDDVGVKPAETSRAAVHRRFLAAAEAWDHDEAPAGLPRRLIVFGISSLPQQALEVLAALSRWVQVLLCVHNPSEHDWSHIVADQDLLRAGRQRQRRRAGSPAEVPEDQLHLHAQPLLAAWGKQGRDFIRLLDQHDEHERYAGRFAAIDQRIDCFVPNAGDTLLRQLQDDIRALRPLHETRATWPALDAAADASLRFHIVHSPQREVEVLHDQLLAAFAADSTLTPRDVIVMVPDIAAYAPHIQAVFGLLPADDARHIAFHVADREQRHHDPLLVALESLLALPDSRLATSDILDLLEVPALQARFRIADEDLPLLRRWIAAAHVRWGLHAEHRESLALPAGMAQNSWDFGLQRMLLGYAVGSGGAWEGVEPLAEIGGLDAAVLGPLVDLVNAVEALWRQLSTDATPAEWALRLRGLLETFFEAEDGSDGFTLVNLDSALQSWLEACDSAGMHDELPLCVVREAWLERLDAAGLEQPFFSGAVTFATLLPMRAIPFRVVALLGMNDGDYPRARPAMDFDLMRADYRPGDRSRREDDRYLFLEALLSARDRLHVSWVGRSIQDQSERPASVLVAQLREHIAAGWRLAGDEAVAQAYAGERLLDRLTLTHRLQPFDDAYFTAGGDPRLFSYAREWHAEPQAQAPAAAAALAPWDFEGPLTLKTLTAFLKDPVGQFLQQRLQVHLRLYEEASADQEPFALDGLKNWSLQDELIQAQAAAMARGEPREAVLQDRLERIARRGELPVGVFSLLQQEDLREPMERMFGNYAEALQTWPLPLPDAWLEHETASAAGPVRFEDSLDSLHADAAGKRCRILLDSGSLVDGIRTPSYRLDQLLAPWVAHVAAQLDGQPLSTHIISKVGSVTLRPLTREQAGNYWSTLIDAWQQGMRRPLPFARKTAAAWLNAKGSNDERRDKARARYELHDPEQQQFGERHDNPALARAYADFDALWSDGEFADWIDRLLKPIDQAIERASDKTRGAETDTGEAA